MLVTWAASAAGIAAMLPGIFHSPDPFLIAGASSYIVLSILPVNHWRYAIPVAGYAVLCSLLYITAWRLDAAWRLDNDNFGLENLYIGLRVGIPLMQIFGTLLFVPLAHGLRWFSRWLNESHP